MNEEQLDAVRALADAARFGMYFYKKEHMAFFCRWCKVQYPAHDPECKYGRAVRTLADVIGTGHGEG